MNNEKKFIKLTPFKMQVLQSFPFIDEDFDALTNYELLCKVVDYLNKTINNVDYLNDEVEEYINKFNELKNYVDNYFDNLDVQEEVNNKLDEMAESGQLTDIIAQYLGLAGMLTFNTVNDMKQATNLVNGSITKTLGYSNINDGGSGNYKIRYITNDDIIDNATIIKLNNSETLIAELIIDDVINARQFGVNPNNNDNINELQKCLNYANKIKKAVYLPSGEYNVSSTLTLPIGVYLYGDYSISNIDSIGSNIIYSGNNICLDMKMYSHIENIYLKGNNQGVGINLSADSILYNIQIKNFTTGVQGGVLNSAPTCKIENVFVWSCTNAFIITSDYTSENTENYIYTQNTSLFNCQVNSCVNGYYINDYSIKLRNLECENSLENAVPFRFGSNAKSCIFNGSYLENSNAEYEIIIDNGAKLNTITGIRYLGWLSKVQNNSDDSNVIIGSALNNQSVQFQKGVIAQEKLSLKTKADYSNLYGFKSNADGQVTEGILYGGAIIKNYDSNLFHKLTNYSGLSRTGGRFINPSVFNTYAENLSIASGGYATKYFTQGFFNTTANTKFVATAMTSENVRINFYMDGTSLVMKVFNDTNALINIDRIDVNVIAWDTN